MDTIASFEIDHTKLLPGLYISRIDDDITTYDMRFIKPNCGLYMSNASMHTIEHLFAVYIRNGKYKDNIIYFGPMGCRTGFYLLVRNMDRAAAIQMVKETIKYIVSYTGCIPGATEIECGNFREHDLIGAKNECQKYYSIIKNIDVTNLKY